MTVSSIVRAVLLRLVDRAAVCVVEAPYSKVRRLPGFVLDYAAYYLFDIRLHAVCHLCGLVVCGPERQYEEHTACMVEAVLSRSRVGAGLRDEVGRTVVIRPSRER